MMFFGIVLGVILITEYARYNTFAKDNSDTKDSDSGLRLYTDHKTGVQYVKAGFFDRAQPRLRADGSVYNIADEDETND